jgi:hypothetical protein
MRNGFSICLLVFVVVGLPGMAAADCNNGVEVMITIGETLTVSPDSVEIDLDASGGGHGRVCWTVEGLTEDLTVHIEGKAGSEELLPNRERTIRLPRTVANSGRPAKSGTWGYSVWVTRDGEGKIMEVDPEIIIRGGGSAVQPPG